MPKKNKNKKVTPKIDFVLVATGSDVTEDTKDCTLQHVLYDVIDEIEDIPTGFIFIPKSGENVRLSMMPQNNNNYKFIWVIAVENYGILSSPKIWKDGHYSCTCFNKKDVSLSSDAVIIDRTFDEKEKMQVVQILHKLNKFQEKALHGVIDLAFKKTREIVEDRNCGACELGIDLYAAFPYMSKILDEAVANVMADVGDKTQDILNTFLSSSKQVDVSKELYKKDFEFVKEVEEKKFLN